MKLFISPTKISLVQWFYLLWSSGPIQFPCSDSWCFCIGFFHSDSKKFAAFCLELYAHFPSIFEICMSDVQEIYCNINSCYELDFTVVLFLLSDARVCLFRRNMITQFRSTTCPCSVDFLRVVLNK
jgi:hypothetical protein